VCELDMHFLTGCACVAGADTSHLHGFGIGKLLPDSWGQLTSLATL
jgi:hypothetical protein